MEALRRQVHPCGLVQLEQSDWPEKVKTKETKKF